MDSAIETRYRVKFTKTGEAKWISHLDLARFFERSIRRADLPIAYSNGFSPHPKISFGQALSVGVESIAEYVDLTLGSQYQSDEIRSRLSSAIADALGLICVIKLGSESKKLGKVLKYADYLISIRLEKADIDRVRNEINTSTYLTSEGIKITSEYNGSKKDDFCEEDPNYLRIIVRTPVNLSPKKIFKDLQNVAVMEETNFKIKRIAQWFLNDEQLVDPIDIRYEE